MDVLDFGNDYYHLGFLKSEDSSNVRLGADDRFKINFEVDLYLYAFVNDIGVNIYNHCCEAVMILPKSNKLVPTQNQGLQYLREFLNYVRFIIGPAAIGKSKFITILIYLP